MWEARPPGLNSSRFSVLQENQPGFPHVCSNLPGSKLESSGASDLWRNLLTSTGKKGHSPLNGGSGSTLGARQCARGPIFILVMEREDGELSQNPVTCGGSGNGDIISKHDSSLVWLCGFLWMRAASGFSKSSSGNLKEVIYIDSKSAGASSRRWIHSLCVIDPGEEKRASPPTEAVYRK